MGRPRKKFRSYEDAKAYLKDRGIKTQKEWHVWCHSGNRPADIPTDPSSAYGAEYKGLADLLGFEPRRRYTKKTRKNNLAPAQATTQESIGDVEDETQKQSTESAAAIERAIQSAGQGSDEAVESNADLNNNKSDNVVFV